MIAWRTTPSGVLVPTVWANGRQIEPPAAPCPAHIKQKLQDLRAEFAEMPGMAARRKREELRAKGAAAEAQRAGRA